MLPLSHLRIYEPLEAYPPDERARWQAYIDSGAPLPSSVVYRDIVFEEEQSTGMIHPLVAEHAFVRRVNGQWLVCPWRIKLRMLVGLLAFRNNLPGEHAEAFVPETQAQRAVTELEKLRESSPELKANIASAPWHVPLRWFLPFEDAERIVALDGDRTRIRYETDLATALSRVERGLTILSSSGFALGVVSAVEELRDWMHEFSEDSLVELDYGGVADLFGDQDLEMDRSAGEVWASLEALETADFDEARERYLGLLEFWSRPQSLETSN